MPTPLIESLLDTDLYKFTMMQCVLHHFSSTTVSYKLQCRNKVNLKSVLKPLKEQVKTLCQLRFKKDELDYLASLDYIKKDFIEFLRLFQLNPDFLYFSIIDDQLDVRVKGPWLHTILFEVPLLAILSESHFQQIAPNPDYQVARNKLKDKILLIQNEPDNAEFQFSDFGTRRRFSRIWQNELLDTLQAQLSKNFIGTSNVYFAYQKGLTPIGTMAHEFLQACQASGPRLIDSQKYALETWVQEYRGRLGIALTDVIHIDAFLKDFDLYFAKLYDGIRQDSGDPIEWGEKAILHYQKLKIDPKTKTFVFSDSLTTTKALALYHHFKGRCKPAFGIGTHLTQDFGYPPLDIVIKMYETNNQPVAKISDSPGKQVCEDENYVKYLKSVFSQKD
ncbi:MAG TPA: nicotinate phosphoribosyltransferase [Gammaproteobacteria bacterium]|nr:nicotinate phosphoribosyltransferase [Gammaproteobacteria bacterium]